MTTAVTTRERNARGEGDRLRGELLEAAADLLAESGSIDSVSLRAVARRVGVSPTAVYRHFEDHTELLDKAVEHCWQSFTEALAAAFSEPDVFAVFVQMGRNYARFALEHPGQYRVMFSSDITMPDSSASVAGTTFDVLVDLVAKMLAELGDDRDPRFVAVQVHTWIHGIVELVGCHPEMDWPPVDEQLTGLAAALGLVRAS